MATPYEQLSTEQVGNYDQEGLRRLIESRLAQASQQMPVAQQAPTQPRALPLSIDQLHSQADKYFKMGSELFNKEPDLSALQNYARQRGQQGNSAMLNALAAQFAGESFAPMQAQFLKQAAAAQDPMKLAGGILTSDGQFLKDPYADQDKKAQFLLQRAQAYQQMAINAQTAQEKNYWNQQNQALQRQLQMLGLDLRRMTLNANASSQQQAQDARMWQVEDRMLDDYEKSVKDPKTVLLAFDNLTNTPKTAAGDLSFIFQYMKMLDPNSVVREGEFATAQNSTGVPDRVRNLYNKVMTGERLNPTQRQEFIDTAGALADVADRRIMGAQVQVSETAKRRGVNPDNIFARHKPRKPAPVTDAGDVPPGMDPETWKYMSPEGRALWKK